MKFESESDYCFTSKNECLANCIHNTASTKEECTTKCTSGKCDSQWIKDSKIFTLNKDIDVMKDVLSKTQSDDTYSINIINRSINHNKKLIVYINEVDFKNLELKYIKQKREKELQKSENIQLKTF